VKSFFFVTVLFSLEIAYSKGNLELNHNNASSKRCCSCSSYSAGTAGGAGGLGDFTAGHLFTTGNEGGPACLFYTAECQGYCLTGFSHESRCQGLYSKEGEDLHVSAASAVKLTSAGLERRKVLAEFEYPNGNPSYFSESKPWVSKASSNLEAFQRELEEKDEWYFRAVGGQATYNRIQDYAVLNSIVEHGSGFFGMDIGKLFVKNFKGWPIDVVGKIGIFDHLEEGGADDFYQYLAYVIFYWTEFPWNKYIKTRIGLGEGISYSEEIPQIEILRLKGTRTATSKLLNYLDYSAAVEIFGNCWVGAGVSHRSGILGLFNGVHGASNFNMFFIEYVVEIGKGPRNVNPCR